MTPDDVAAAVGPTIERYLARRRRLTGGACAAVGLAHVRSRRRPDPAAALARDPDALAARLRDVSPEAAARPAEVRVVHAPGRVNLIGEHTDYNEGFVLPVAIDLGIAIALRARPTTGASAMTLAATGETLRFRPRRDRAEGGAPGSTTSPARPGRWRSAGVAPRGFRGVLASDLPQGSGLSAPRRWSWRVARAVGRRAARARPDDARPDGAARRERLRRRQLRAHGPVRVGVRRGRPRAAARLPDARAPRGPAADPTTSRWSSCHSGSPRRLETSAYNERRSPVRGRRRGDRADGARRHARCAT